MISLQYNQDVARGLKEKVLCDCGNTLMIAETKYRFAVVTDDGHIEPFGKWTEMPTWCDPHRNTILFCPKCGMEYQYQISGGFVEWRGERL